jgi:hypothetical protein
MLTKGFVLVVGALVILLSLGGSWGMVVLASGDTVTAPTSPTSNSPGNAGTNGKNGSDGTNGTSGQAGFNGTDGTAGATGEHGPTGPQGATGPQGPAGPSGASAPTFSAISASGTTMPAPGLAFTFSTQTTAVPAGPALVGFSVGLQDIFGSPYPVSCSLVDPDAPTTVFATTAAKTISFLPSFSTFAATQVVNLTATTTLAVRCTSKLPNYSPFYNYQDLSIYAISFAP